MLHKQQKNVEAESGNGARQRRVAAPKTGRGESARGEAWQSCCCTRFALGNVHTECQARRRVYLRRESQLSIWGSQKEINMCNTARGAEGAREGAEDFAWTLHFLICNSACCCCCCNANKIIIQMACFTHNSSAHSCKKAAREGASKGGVGGREGESQAGCITKGNGIIFLRRATKISR